jgi:hypothetical protein
MATIILGSQWGKSFFIIVGPASHSDMRYIWRGQGDPPFLIKELWNLITVGETDLPLV